MKQERLKLNRIRAINYRNFDTEYVWNVKVRSKKPFRRYNCMAYALGQDYWMLPAIDNSANLDEDDYDDENDYYADDYDRRAFLIAKELEEVHKLIPIDRKDMVRGKEYVAMRTGPDDFHFILRDKSGRWSHKMGNYPVQYIKEFLVLNSAYWGDPDQTYYDSDIYLFEKPSK